MEGSTTGCGCGAKKGTIDKPLIAGRINGADPVEGMLKISYGRVAAGSKAWVTGDGVDLWVEKGYIVLSDSLVETP